MPGEQASRRAQAEVHVMTLLHDLDAQAIDDAAGQLLRWFTIDPAHLLARPLPYRPATREPRSIGPSSLGATGGGDA